MDLEMAVGSGKVGGRGGEVVVEYTSPSSPEKKFYNVNICE